MAMERVFRVPLTKTRSRAMFIVLVLLANLFVGSLSTASTYADHMHDMQATVTTDSTESKEQQPNENETNSFQIPERPERPAKPVLPAEVEKSESSQSAEVNQPTIGAVNLRDMSVDISFDCWMQTSATDYMFSVIVETDRDFSAEVGENNYTDPTDYQNLMPTKFTAGSKSYKVEGWDGEKFDWHLLGERLRINPNGTNECDQTTLLDLIEASDQHKLLVDVLKTASKGNPECTALINQLDSVYAGPFTVFAPTDEAINQLVRFPGQLDDELGQLEANPDEMCALIASHIIAGKVVSADITPSSQTVFTIQNDTDGIMVRVIANTARVDDATVVAADMMADNGVLHAVNQVILPQSVGTITPIKTDKTAPALHGTIKQAMFTPTAASQQVTPEPCVLVRIDGMPYKATVDGGNWSIAAGTVTLNPTKSDTLFDVVVRTAGPTGCNAETDSDTLVRSGEDLLGLTMVRGILSYLEPAPAPDPGVVLGVTSKPEVVETTPVVLPAVHGVGKGGGEIAQVDPSTIDTDGDGVVDSEDLDPNDPSVTGRDTDGDGVIDSEDPDPNDPNVTGQEEEQNQDQTAEADDNAVFWWFVVGGGVVVLAYLLRQRGGLS